LVGTPIFYNILGGQTLWTIGVTNFAYSKLAGLAQNLPNTIATMAAAVNTSFNASETGAAHFNIYSNVILFGAKTYAKLTSVYTT